MHLVQWLQQADSNKLAVIEGDLRLTYGQLRQRVAVRAGELIQQGVEPGDRVAALSANRVELWELFLACAWVGAIFVPLNTRLTRPEWEVILSDAQPRLLFAEDAFLGQAPEHPGLLRLAEVSGPPEPARPAAANEPVAILYTGGTTGVPKGALLTQDTIHWNARNTVEGWGLRSDDVAPIFTPMFHTGGLNVMATPLLSIGGTMVLPGPFEPEKALELIEQEGCTLLFLVPTMFTMLADAPSFSAERLRTVRQMISGGAPCPQPLFERYWSLGLPLRQGYGLTEAGPNNFGITLEEAKTQLGTVGRPLPHVAISLLDENGAEVGVDQVGELHIRGGHVMPGYWQRPNESQAVLGRGWLRTGDLARRNAEGFVTICGRSKEMYISGGENVFPAEIEEVLLAHPEVREAAVVGVADPRWGEVGRAYLVCREGASLTPDDLIDFCLGRLARYKTPRQVVFLEALPKSSAGKILKRELANV